MYIVLYTTTGNRIKTCPAAGISGKTGGSKSENDMDGYAYPNPVRGGDKIYLKESVITDGEQERYATYRLFNSVGMLMLSGSASALIEGLTMPETAGTYFLILDGKAGRRVIQIAVVERTKN